LKDSHNLLTIITCSKSDIVGLRATLNSFLKIRKNFAEILVIASKYSREELISIQNEFLSLKLDIQIPKKDGIYEAMNLGLEHAHGEYVIFINGGDLLDFPEALEILTNELNGRSWGFGSLSIHAGSSQERVYRFDPYRQLLHRMGIKYCPHPATVIKRKTAIFLGGFNPKYKVAADQDLLLKFSKMEPPLVSTQKISGFILGGVSTRPSKEIHQDFKNISQENFGFFFNSALIDTFIWKLLGFMRNLLT